MKRVIVIFGIAISYLVGFSQETGTFTDLRDGNIYKTVKIGTQVWMAQNLSYADTGSFCYDFEEKCCAIFGRLYTFEAAQKVCPEGWHFPKETEWITLIEYLGGRHDAGDKMKQSGGSRWICKDNNVESTNTSGFTALPAGQGKVSAAFFSKTTTVSNGVAYEGVKYDGRGSFFNGLGIISFWWSINSNGKASVIALANKNIYRDVKYGPPVGGVSKKMGFSVRCLKD